MYTAVMVTPGPPSTLPEEEVIPGAPADWSNTNYVATSIDFIPLQMSKDQYEQTKSVVREQARHLGIEKTPLDEINKEDRLFTTVAHEIVSHENTMFDLSLSNIHTTEELAQQRADLRMRAMLVGRNSQKDDSQFHRNEKANQERRDNDDDQFVDDGDDDDKKDDEEVQLEINKKSQPMPPPTQPKPNAPRRGRRSSYLQDFKLLQTIEQNRHMVMPGQSIPGQPGQPLMAGAEGMIGQNGQPLTAEQYQLMQQMQQMQMQSPDMLAYQQQFAMQQQQQYVQSAEGQVPDQSLQQEPPDAPDPQDAQQMEVKEEM